MHIFSFNIIVKNIILKVTPYRCAHFYLCKIIKLMFHVIYNF